MWSWLIDIQPTFILNGEKQCFSTVFHHNPDLHKTSVCAYDYWVYNISTPIELWCGKIIYKISYLQRVCVLEIIMIIYNDKYGITSWGVKMLTPSMSSWSVVVLKSHKQNTKMFIFQAIVWDIHIPMQNSCPYVKITSLAQIWIIYRGRFISWNCSDMLVLS